MPYQANTDRDLARAGSRQRANGGRLLLIGGILFALGLLVRIVGGGEDVIAFIGVALMTLALPPLIAGAAVLLSGLVSRRASRRRPFA